MTYIERTIRYFFLMLLYNLVLLSPMMPDKLIRVLSCTGLMLFYLYCHIIPVNASCKGQRIRILHGGYELVLASIVTFLIETVNLSISNFQDSYTGTSSYYEWDHMRHSTLFIVYEWDYTNLYCSGQLGFFKKDCTLAVLVGSGIESVSASQFH